MRKAIELIKQKFEDPNTVTLSEILFELEELERLAEIGRAVEWGLSEEGYVFMTPSNIEHILKLYRESEESK